MNAIDFAAWQAEATSFEHMVAYDLYRLRRWPRRRGVSRARSCRLPRDSGTSPAREPLLGACPRRAIARCWSCRIACFASGSTATRRSSAAPMTLDGQQMTIGGVLPRRIFSPQLPDRRLAAWHAIASMPTPIA